MIRSMGSSGFSPTRPAVWAILPIAIALTVVTGAEASLPARLAAARDAELMAQLAAAESSVGRRAAGLVFARAGDDRGPALAALVVGTAEHGPPMQRKRGA